MAEITVNREVILNLNGVDEIAYCTSMSRRTKIKIVAFRCTSKRAEQLLRKAVANYNKSLLSMLINQEQIWFKVIKLDRNIPLSEFRL